MNGLDLESVFAQIPLLCDRNLDDFTLTPLPGYTNRNFRLHNRAHDWVLRVPKQDTDRFIDRAAEANNQSLASALDIAPRAVWRDAHGMSLTPTLVASRALVAEDFANSAMLQCIVEPIRRLHQSELQFDGAVDLSELLARYFGMLAPAEQKIYRNRMKQAHEVLKRLEHRDRPAVPSHNDLVLENLLLDDHGLWLIDWEYSAMASPYWDLATLCNAAQLNFVQSRDLLQAYCAGDRGMEESVLSDYRILLQLLSDCWMTALVPVKNSS